MGSGQGAATFVMTEGVFLFADPAEVSIEALPVLDDDAVAAELAARGFAGAAVRRGMHTHVDFFKHLRSVFATRYPRWAIADVGGYIGEIGLPLARWISTLEVAERASVTVFEPTVLADYIQRSIDFNGLGAVASVRGQAVSDRDGDVKLLPHAMGRVSAQVLALRPRFLGNLRRALAKARGRLVEEKAETVSAVRLDTLYGNESGALLIFKIDTEGHEPAVLNGMARTLAANPCILILEYHAWCARERVLGKAFANYLLDNFVLYNAGNIGYIKTLTPIENARALEEAAHRDGHALTDILCFSRKLSPAGIEAAVAPYLA